MSLLSEKALLLAKVETTAGVDASPVVSADAILAQEPSFEADVTIIERTFARPDLSRYPNRIGRKLAQISFSVDVQGNSGVRAAAAIGDAPKLAQLLRGCGFGLSVLSGTNQIGPVVSGHDNVGSLGLVTGGTVTLSDVVLYTLTCETAGASGVAQVRVKSNNAVEDDLGAGTLETVTDAIDINLGGSGAALTPTIGSDLVVGDIWHVLVSPVGVQALPVSDGDDFETLTLYLWKDGIQHILTGAMGTVSFSAESGDVAKAEFSFTGNYNTPTDVAFPAVLESHFEGTVPPLVENALITFGGNSALVPGGFSADIQNSVNPREDANSPQGYNGVRIGSRAPSGAFSPEAQAEADYPFWSNFEAGKVQHFMARVGNAASNTIVIEVPRCQAQSHSIGDRNSLMTYDVDLGFFRYTGDDEIRFIFT